MLKRTFILILLIFAIATLTLTACTGVQPEPVEEPVEAEAGEETQEGGPTLKG